MKLVSASLVKEILITATVLLACSVVALVASYLLGEVRTPPSYKYDLYAGVVTRKELTFVGQTSSPTAAYNFEVLVDNGKVMNLITDYIVDVNDSVCIKKRTNTKTKKFKLRFVDNVQCVNL